MPAKRAPKKAAPGSAHRHTAQDLRRAYEHMGRVEILEGALAGSPYRDVSALATLAQQELAAGRAREAADLLRAAEHLTFAALAPRRAAANAAAYDPLSTGVSSRLEAAIAAEFDHLIRRAQQHQGHVEDNPGHTTLDALYATTIEHARSTFAAGAFRPALELARAAEAISHVATHNAAKAPAANDRTHRLAS